MMSRRPPLRWCGLEAQPASETSTPCLVRAGEEIRLGADVPHGDVEALKEGRRALIESHS
jgi:hypothetical protein